MSIEDVRLKQDALARLVKYQKLNPSEFQWERLSPQTRPGFYWLRERRPVDGGWLVIPMLLTDTAIFVTPSNVCFNRHSYHAANRGEVWVCEIPVFST